MDGRNGPSTLFDTVSDTTSPPSRGAVRAVVRPVVAPIALVCTALIASVLLSVTVTGSAPVGAQAAPVQVTSRTEPEVPEAGDDVAVRVRATGCPPGGALVEVYITSSDGRSSTAALMARAEAQSTLFFRVKTEVELPQALEGWYGVRVVCGQFRPARAPMAGTTFRVGVSSDKSMNVSATQVVAGGTLHIDGNRCQGDGVEYSLSESGRQVGAFKSLGSLPVNPDGTWGGDITAPVGLPAGRAELRARCGLINQFGDQVWINYDDAVAIEILPGPPVTTAAPTQ